MKIDFNNILKDLGYSIQASHYRYMEKQVSIVDSLGKVSKGTQICGLLPSSDQPDMKEKGWKVRRCGGGTEVSISRDGNLFSTGRAECSITDEFSRSQGFNIAFGRAIKEAGIKDLIKNHLAGVYEKG